MSIDISQLMADLRHPDAGRVDELFPSSRRLELRREIIARERPNTSEPTSRLRGGRTERRHWPLALTPTRRHVLLSTLGALAVVAAAVALIAGSAVRPQPASGAVAFRTDARGEIVATVTNPFAAEDRLKAAFAAHGLDITMSLVPVSPSLVGTVVYISNPSSAAAIEPLQGGHCVTGGGGCAIGVKVPVTFTGPGYITLGRPAKPGESYESQASALAPGEPLHCSGLLGTQVSQALTMLNKDKLAVVQWRADTVTHATSYEKLDASPPLANYVWSIDSVAPGKVRVWTQPTRWPDDDAHGAQVNRGC
jgi:hypothetical protein